MTKADEYCAQLRNENRILLAQLESAREQAETSMLLCADHQSLLVKHLALKDAAVLVQLASITLHVTGGQALFDEAIEALRKAMP